MTEHMGTKKLSNIKWSQPLTLSSTETMGIKELTANFCSEPWG